MIVYATTNYNKFRDIFTQIDFCFTYIITYTFKGLKMLIGTISKIKL